MKKLVLFLLLMLVLFLSGCEALKMNPDAWLDPYRWDQAETAKANLQQANPGKGRTQF